MSSRYKGKVLFKGVKPPPAGPPSEKSWKRLKNRKKMAGEVFYKESEDNTTTTLLNKIDSKAKDVSYLERERPRRQQAVNSTEIDAQIADESADVISSYDALLHSFNVKDIHEARKVAKKRKNLELDENGEYSDSEPKSQKHPKKSKFKETEKNGEEEDDVDDEDDYYYQNGNAYGSNEEQEFEDDDQNLDFMEEDGEEMEEDDEEMEEDGEEMEEDGEGMEEDAEEEEEGEYDSELEDYSEDDEDIKDRKRHERQVERIRRELEAEDLGPVEFKEGKHEKEEQRVYDQHMLDMNIVDPYDKHFEHVYSQEEIDELNNFFKGPQKFDEVFQKDQPKNAPRLLGTVWVDGRTSHQLPYQDLTSNFHIKPKLVHTWNSLFKEVLGESSDSLKNTIQDVIDKTDNKTTSENGIVFPLMTQTQKQLFSLFDAYYDVLYCLRGPLNGLEVMSIYTLHVANHVLKCLERIKKSNQQIHEIALKRRKIKEEITSIRASVKKQKEKEATEAMKSKNKSGKANNHNDNKNDNRNNNKDQTETEADSEKKPILPNFVPGEEAIQVDENSINYCDPLVPIEKKLDRLKELHSKLREEEPEFRDQGFTKPKVLVLLPMKNSALEFVELLMKTMPKQITAQVQNKRKFYGEYFEEAYTSRASRPLEWLATFRGNKDDTFRLGISFKSKGMKLFSSFYNSEIIVASPLGLRLAYDESEEGATDYLSSLELVICDQTDVMLMQNWDHVQYVFEKISKLPAKSRETDFSRVRNFYLNQHAPFYRQTLIFGNTINVDINALFNRRCQNSFGRVKIRRPNLHGTVSQILATAADLRQVFYRLDPPNASAVDDYRLEYFTTQIYEHLKGAQNDGVLVVIPSYFDYVRVRNFFKKVVLTDEINAVAVSEYTTEIRGIKYRKHFYLGNVQVMLITERYHFYTRIRIRGIKSIIFYSPPLFAHFYSELANWVEQGGSILTLYTKYDSFNLEGIVGRERCEQMLLSEKSTHSLS